MSRQPSLRMTFAVLAVITLCAATAASCRKAGSDTPREQHELPAQSVTHWTDKTEVFMEHPVLVAGQTARFAVHLTTLADFKALNAGRPTIQFRARDGRTTTLEGSDALRPGAFRVEGKIPAAGDYTWSLIVNAPGLTDTHDLGKLTVHPDEAAARAAVGEEAESAAISYLKEQQWTNPFATAIVTTESLRDALRVPATIAPIAGGEALVSAPSDGRLAPGTLPAVGARVAAGDVLARFEPRLSAIEDRASLVQHVAEADAAVSAAQAEHDRATRLLAERAVPARRVEDAARALTVARAQLQAAQTRLQQRDETLRSGGAGAGGNTFALRAPIAGRVVAITATPGAAYQEGAELFRIVRTDPVLLEAQVPAAHASRSREIVAAEIELPGQTSPIALRTRRTSNPGVLDPSSRALVLRLEVDNGDGRLLIGDAGTAVLYTTRREDVPAIPVSAVLTEGGRPIAFVQTEGERFEKRTLELGPRDGALVAVRSGLKPGERIVTRGAYEVLLASAAKGLPAEGHVH